MDIEQKIKEILIDNPDLSYEFVRDVLVAEGEMKNGEFSEFKNVFKVTEYETFGTR